MNANTTSAKRKTAKVYSRNGATIRAILLVVAVFSLISPTVQQLIALFLMERGDVPDIGWLFLVVGVFQATLRALIPATCFVLIFWFAKDFFLERWVLYGTVWWCVSMLGAACMAATGSSGLAASVLHTVLSLVAFMSCAYLTKVIYSRTLE
jgi:hypothetical protein